MTRRIKIIRFLTLFIISLGISCATIRFQEDISDYFDDIQKLESKLKADPDNAEALRDLGVIYFQTQHYPKAKEYLQKAFAENPQDPKTIFYYGMALEFRNEIKLAIKLHESYSKVSRLSPYRKLMQGRYIRLTREIMRIEMRALLKQEQQLSDENLSPNTVAVFPFSYEGNDKKYAPLGKGLSEMMIIDLGQVNGLKVLERIRLQALLDELAFAQTQYVDPTSAPRVGKILGAGSIIAGAYNVLDKKHLRMDVAFWDVLNRQFPSPTGKTDALANLYYLEKDLVFNVIVEMGIELSLQEREKIFRVPTKNMQAFLAYCRGLDKEDAGQFKAAAKFYQKAIKLDPNFELAGNKAEAAEGLTLAGGSRADVLVQARKIEGKPSIPTVSMDNLISNRLQNLGINVGSNFVPGQDSREPVEEGIDLELPEPPTPPDRQ